MHVRVGGVQDAVAENGHEHRHQARRIAVPLAEKPGEPGIERLEDVAHLVSFVCVSVRECSVLCLFRSCAIAGWCKVQQKACSI